MATFAGTTADVYVDPITRAPVEDAHLLVYSAASGGSQITDLTDWAGNPLPGYVATDEAGAFAFKTVSDAYSIVWVQDPSGHRYQCQSRESVQAGVDAAAAIPVMESDVAAAVDASNEAKSAMTTVARDIEFQGMVSGIGSVDVRTATPTQAVKLGVSTTGVIQHAVREQATGEWYVSHNDTGTASGRETTVIDRLSPSGVLLDTMTLVDAGHGTFIAAEQRDDGNVWIWVPFKIYDTAGNTVSTNVYRIRYRPGVTITNVAADAPNSVMVVPSGPGVSTQAYLDVPAGRVVVSVAGKYSLYDKSDLEANGLAAATKIGTTVPAQPGTIQGVAVAGTQLYRLTGTDNTSVTGEPKLITVFSLLTGKKLYQRDITADVALGEPEGLTVWRDAAGFPVLYVGISTGAGGARTTYLYQLSSGLPQSLSLPINPVMLGAVPNSTAAASATTAAINAALAAGNVALPAGVWWVNDSIRIPSRRSLRGAGRDRTWLKMVDGALSNAPVVTNAGNTNSAHTNPDVYLHVADLSIDGNRLNRNSDPQVNENGCALTLRCVEHAVVERVYGFNGTHSFDVSASVYMPDALAVNDPNKMPPGPSRWVVFRDCVAGGSEDDAFTTHCSQYITFERCIAWNHEAAPRTPHSNGFEIDDGSLDVTLDHCYIHGFHDGVQIKGHNQNLPARRVTVRDTTADACQIGFRIFWDSLNMLNYAGPFPNFQLAADVDLLHCKVTNCVNYDGGLSVPALVLEAYEHVNIEDFVIYDSPKSNVIIRNGCSDVRITNIRAENVWNQPYDPTLGLITLYDTAGKDIRVNNVRVERYTSLLPVVNAQQTQAVSSYLIEDVKATTTANPPLWSASTAYPVAAIVKLSTGELLAATVAGTSGTAAPTSPAFNTNITDGTVTWIRIAGAAVQQQNNTAQKAVRRITQTGFTYTAYVVSGTGASTYAGQPPIVTGWWA